MDDRSYILKEISEKIRKGWFIYMWTLDSELIVFQLCPKMFKYFFQYEKSSSLLSFTHLFLPSFLSSFLFFFCKEHKNANSSFLSFFLFSFLFPFLNRQLMNMYYLLNIYLISRMWKWMRCCLFSGILLKCNKTVFYAFGEKCTDYSKATKETLVNYKGK